MWIIIGLVIFFITYYVHKHTYDSKTYNHETRKYEYDSKDKVSSPLWLILIFFIVSMIPFLNIIGFMIGAVCYFHSIIFEEDMYFKPEGIIKKIFNFLTREV